ncbi:MAG: hypothetical protein GX683_01410 [Ruminococcaceae bacterium]|nr:hypothetical protein [Oscillospiraceae bacterium]
MAEKTSDNEMLLIGIHKGAEMGRNTIDKLIGFVEDKVFKGLLESQHDEYNRVYMASDVLIKSMDGDDRGVPPIAKTMGNMMIDIKAGGDNSVSNLAEMVLQGTEKGMEQLSKDMEDYSMGAKEETLNLANAYGEFLERNRHELKKFL